MRQWMKLVAIVVAALALGVGLSPARADTLVLGSVFSSIPMMVDGTLKTEGGGSIEAAKLNGTPLEWVYCVDIYTNVYVPATYSNTVVTYNGTINGLPVHNADQVAWLLTQYGVAGQGDQAKALQAAIWETIFDGYNGHSVVLANTASANVKNLKSGMLTALGNAGSVSGLANDFLWMTPKTGATAYQGLVARPVPDGGVTLMLLGGALVGLETLRRKARI